MIALYAALGKASGGTGLLYGYKGPVIMLMSIAVFSIATEFRAGPVVRLIAPASFGIYLVHVAILELFVRHVLPVYSMPPWFSAPIGMTVVLGIAFVLVWILRSVPGVNRVIT